MRRLSILENLAIISIVIVSIVAKKPNIIFIITDDQDYMLAGWNDQSYKLIGDQGMEFYGYYTHSPICCISRSAILTGRYMHNIRESSFPGICDDNATDCGCMYINTDAAFEQHSVAMNMQELGYTTGYFGKYLNTQALVPYCFSGSSNRIAPGWDQFNIQCYQTYFNDTWSINGNVSMFPDYTISKIGNDSIAWLASILSQSDHKPIFTMLGPRAPHPPYTPAPWYANANISAQNPTFPSFDYAATDHPPFIANIPALTSKWTEELAFDFVQRARTMLSVHDLTLAILNILEHYQEINNTYLFFGSDNGFHLGEFRLSDDKTHPYEFDVRVPFSIRGPNIQSGTKVFVPISGVDLAPTWIELAGGQQKPAYMDGRSFASLLTNSSSNFKQNVVLIEYYSTNNGSTDPWKNGNDDTNNTHRSIRIIDPVIGNLSYIEYAQVFDWYFSNIIFYELYDLIKDPYQLDNIYSKQSSDMKDWLHISLLNLWTCGPAYVWNETSMCPELSYLKPPTFTINKASNFSYFNMILCFDLFLLLLTVIIIFNFMRIYNMIWISKQEIYRQKL